MLDISLVQAQLISLGLTTFLYGMARKLLSSLADVVVWKGIFTPFVTTIIVMTHKVTEHVHKQHMKVIRVSFVMLSGSHPSH